MKTPIVLMVVGSAQGIVTVILSTGRTSIIVILVNLEHHPQISLGSTTHQPFRPFFLKQCPPSSRRTNPPKKKCRLDFFFCFFIGGMKFFFSRIQKKPLKFPRGVNRIAAEKQYSWKK